MNTVVHMSQVKKNVANRAYANKQATAISLCVVPPVTANLQAGWVDESVSGHPYQWIARALWNNQPNLRVATERLALYITPWWPDMAGKPVLHRAVMTALMKTQDALKEGDGLRLARLTGVYLHALTSFAQEITRVSVTGVNPDGELCHWNHFSEPLYDWAHSKQIGELMAHVANPAPTEEMILGVRTHMIASLTDPVDAGYLAKHAPLG